MKTSNPDKTAQTESVPVNMESTETQKPGNRKSAILKSTGMMSMLILFSRVTGFIRTWAMAFALGDTVLAASYSLANNLPNMIYELVAGGVLSTAFLPIYLQQRNLRSRKDANLYASNLLSVAIVFLGIIAVLASVFAPQVMITQSLFSSAQNETVESAVWLFRFFAFQIIFYGISAIFGGLLNAERQYFWPSISSVFMNLITIITFFAYPFISETDSTAGLTLLAVGTTLSIAVMAFVQIPALVKSGFKFKFFIDFKGEGLRDTVKLALPAIACTAINLVSLSFMNSTALAVADNGPASISYAWMWYQFPYGVLGVALSTAMFTEMSDALSHQDHEHFKSLLNGGLKTTWLLIIPMACMVWICAYELIGLYASGKFTAESIIPVGELLRGWAIALPLYASYMFLYRAFSALKDLKTIAICNLFLTVVQVSGYIFFTGIFSDEISMWGLTGIAMGDTIFYLLMNVVLLLVLRRRVGTFHFKEVIISTIKVSVASFVGATLANILVVTAFDFISIGSTLGSFIVLMIKGVIGLAFIFILCRLFKVDEVTELAGKIARKLKR